jgi:hypothetical protein
MLSLDSLLYLLRLGRPAHLERRSMVVILGRQQQIHRRRNVERHDWNGSFVRLSRKIHNGCIANRLQLRLRASSNHVRKGTANAN